MKIREIRLETIIVYKDGSEIYNGKVENASKEILEQEVLSIHFESGNLVIEV